MSQASVLGDDQGLDEATAARRLAECGPNEIEKARTRSGWAILLGILQEPMFLLVIGASALYLLIGDLGEGIFLLCGAALTIGLVVVQEVRSEGALQALRDLAQPFARVIRNGKTVRILARDVAPGDLMLIGEGDRIPADGVLVAGDVLSVDESLLTGESAPVIRQAATVDKADQEVFAGTLVVRGGAKARVEQTGPRTRFGMIGASLSCGHEELTPLQATTRRLVFYLAIAALLFSSVVLGLYGLMRGDWLQGALTALTVAIALLPEEFPMVLAVFLALGSWRLARHHVLVLLDAEEHALDVDGLQAISLGLCQLARGLVRA